MKNTNPSVNQMGALLRFAHLVGQNRRWKDRLRSCWACSEYLLDTTVEDSALLQGLRNQFGPSWLARVSLNEIAKAVLSAELPAFNAAIEKNIERQREEVK
jgi:hypothetical protein